MIAPDTVAARTRLDARPESRGGFVDGVPLAAIWSKSSVAWSPAAMVRGQAVPRLRATAGFCDVRTGGRGGGTLPTIRSHVPISQPLRRGVFCARVARRAPRVIGAPARPDGLQAVARSHRDDRVTPFSVASETVAAGPGFLARRAPGASRRESCNARTRGLSAVTPSRADGRREIGEM
jgi:hypothetical protein